MFPARETTLSQLKILSTTIFEKFYFSSTNCGTLERTFATEGACCGTSRCGIDQVYHSRAPCQELISLISGARLNFETAFLIHPKYTLSPMNVKRYYKRNCLVISIITAVSCDLFTARIPFHLSTVAFNHGQRRGTRPHTPRGRALVPFAPACRRHRIPR